MVTRETYATRHRFDGYPIWEGKGPLLGHLDLELTERCNNNCIHCYINRPADDLSLKDRELSTSRIKEILEEAASLGCLTLRMTGGEPLLREDFEDIYLFARGLGLKVVLLTNGTLITPDLAALFARVRCLEKIEITVYGMNRRAYEAVTRVPGSYEAAWRGINLLLENKIPFVPKGVLLSTNWWDRKDFEKWAATVPWMDGRAAFSMSLDLRARRDSEEKNDLIKKLRLSADEVLQVLIGWGEEYVKEMKEFCSKFLGPPGDKLLSCGAGVGGGCVDAYGRFQPCMLLRHPDTVYDLKEGSLKEAMTHFVPEVRAIKASDPDYKARCARCFLKGLCEQCPAKSWMEHGTLDTPVEYLCDTAHAQARYLGLLEEGENAWEVKDWAARIRSFAEEE